MPSATVVPEAPESTAGSVPFPPSRSVRDERVQRTQDDLIWPTPLGAAIKLPEEKGLELPSAYSAEPHTGANGTVSSEEDLGDRFRLTQLQRILQPELTQEAQQWLTGDLDVINQRVMLLCMEQARRMHVQVKKLRAFVKGSWEGEFSELVLQVFVEANIPQSLALWDSVGEALQRWGRRQPSRRRRVLNEKYGVFVETLRLP